MFAFLEEGVEKEIIHSGTDLPRGKSESEQIKSIDVCGDLQDELGGKCIDVWGSVHRFWMLELLDLRYSKI